MVPTWMAVAGTVAGLLAGALTGFCLGRLIGAALRYGRHSLDSSTPALARADITAPERKLHRPSVNQPGIRQARGGWSSDPRTDHLSRRPAPAAVRPYVARHAWPDDEA